jgi:antitoxin (DNA-binding transcriptional repressor) of toxin-antitoxin stability system
MTTISKSKLKARMLQIFREIEQSGQPITVTDHGQPVLKIQPITKKRSVEEVFGPLQGQVVYHNDINEPTLEEWSET